MKPFFMIAAAIAAVGAVPALASTPTGNGHWEWRSRPQFGPSKTASPPARYKVWIKDASETASCDCSMMRNAEAEKDCADAAPVASAPRHG